MKGSIAQRIERWPSEIAKKLPDWRKPRVGGSNPPAPIILNVLVKLYNFICLFILRYCEVSLIKSKKINIVNLLIQIGKNESRS